VAAVRPASYFDNSGFLCDAVAQKTLESFCVATLKASQLLFQEYYRPRISLKLEIGIKIKRIFHL
jgi:hypothetical protein